MLECYNCKSFLSCLHNGQIHINDDIGLQCDFYEKASKNEIGKEQVIDGIVYCRMISEGADE